MCNFQVRHFFWLKGSFEGWIVYTDKHAWFGADEDKTPSHILLVLLMIWMSLGGHKLISLVLYIVLAATIRQTFILTVNNKTGATIERKELRVQPFKIKSQHLIFLRSFLWLLIWSVWSTSSHPRRRNKTFRIAA